jgi:hypothetical protein
LRFIALIGLGFGGLFSVPSFAATVEPVQGEVAVNRGDGVFRHAPGSLEATIGDSLLVPPGGLARITYPDGCVVDLTPGTVVTITTDSPCKAPSDTASSDFSVGGTVAVGAGIAAAVILLLSNKKNDAKPASP